MRNSLLAFAALAACSRAPVIDLPVYGGGVPIDASAKHTMTIDAQGRVTVDGVACANEGQVESALGKVRAAMYSDPADVRRSGFEFASDPLIVRIDGATRWADAARDALAGFQARRGIAGELLGRRTRPGGQHASRAA